MDLALDAGISPRHLSFVETGRALPSRRLLLLLSQELKLPLRHRNTLLTAAGYAPEFGQEPLNGRKMEVVRQALQRVMDKHEPFPAFVVDTGYDILMTNAGFEQLVRFFAGAHALKRYRNLYRLVFAKDGLGPWIRDRQAMEGFLLARLREEAASTRHEGLMALHREISQEGSGGSPDDLGPDTSLPILSLTLEKAAVKASLFSMMTTLGTPLDMTAQELRIETFFPADEETRNLFPMDF
jgi:transcriptional regulator with XRE-family HTH domain